MCSGFSDTEFLGSSLPDHEFNTTAGLSTVVSCTANTGDVETTMDMVMTACKTACLQGSHK